MENALQAKPGNYDPLWKPIPDGSASGHQFPTNWWVEGFALNWNQQNNTVNGDSYWQKWANAIAYCRAHHMYYPRVQLYYFLTPGGDKESMQTWLQTIARPNYLGGSVLPCYEIACNEPLEDHGHDSNGGTLEQEYGGPGRTYGVVVNGIGYDWLVNLLKDERAILGPNVKLGLNEFNVESIHEKNWNQVDNYISLINQLRAAGVPLDWVGIEGYWVDRTCTVADVQATVDMIAQQTGLPIIFTEFTPWSYRPNEHPTQQACWQAYLTMFASDPNVIGVSGPWQGFRSSEDWGCVQQNCCQPNAFYYDASSHTGCVGGNGTASPAMVDGPVLKWLQGWTPTGISPPVSP
jgi:hypothetical protein